eukprot:CAMPEP_0180748706 /NCGR_PEP_ID=MMETSP1038_2-20121128/30197_1 /TAXON_ID=632150 /ORGANISM="Azadinium spinosum, Strain 3D9" /LENGTH=124 /DNA_ID=CAMNT_0022782353 /DNA_START=229 /DNA_END=600 /DNA_ORIENTATION=-
MSSMHFHCSASLSVATARPHLCCVSPLQCSSKRCSSISKRMEIETRSSSSESKGLGESHGEGDVDGEGEGSALARERHASMATGEMRGGLPHESSAWRLSVRKLLKLVSGSSSTRPERPSGRRW